MNREIEFHDSTLKEIKLDGDNAVLCLDEAYVHLSDGTPGLDIGTDWAQKININLQDVSVLEMPDDLPNRLDDGYFIVQGLKTSNMMKLPYKTEDQIEIVLLTQYGQKLHLIAKSAFTQEVGEARYVDIFPGIEK